MTPEPPPASTFVLRLWLERGGGGGEPDEWRGELKRVPDGRADYFRTLEALPPLLARLLGRGRGGAPKPESAADA